MQSISLARIAVALLLTAPVAAILQLPALAQGSVVTIHAYDAKGKDLKKCLATTHVDNTPKIAKPPAGTPPAALTAAQSASMAATNTAIGTLLQNPKPYVLAACDDKAVAQRFVFNTNGAGGPLCQWVGESWMTDGKLFCATPGPYRVGSPVTEIPQGAPGTSQNWRWTNQQIVETDSPGQSMCLTGDAKDKITLGECSKPATLTHWDMLLVK